MISLTLSQLVGVALLTFPLFVAMYFAEDLEDVGLFTVVLTVLVCFFGGAALLAVGFVDLPFGGAA